MKNPNVRNLHNKMHRLEQEMAGRTSNEADGETRNGEDFFIHTADMNKTFSSHGQMTQPIYNDYSNRNSDRVNIDTQRSHEDAPILELDQSNADLPRTID